MKLDCITLDDRGVRRLGGRRPAATTTNALTIVSTAAVTASVAVLGGVRLLLIRVLAIG